MTRRRAALVALIATAAGVIANGVASQATPASVVGCKDEWRHTMAQTPAESRARFFYAYWPSMGACHDMTRCGFEDIAFASKDCTNVGGAALPRQYIIYCPSKPAVFVAGETEKECEEANARWRAGQGQLGPLVRELEGRSHQKEAEKIARAQASSKWWTFPLQIGLGSAKATGRCEKSVSSPTEAAEMMQGLLFACHLENDVANGVVILDCTNRFGHEFTTVYAHDEATCAATHDRFH